MTDRHARPGPRRPGDRPRVHPGQLHDGVRRSGTSGSGSRRGCQRGGRRRPVAPERSPRRRPRAQAAAVTPAVVRGRPPGDQPRARPGTILVARRSSRTPATASNRLFVVEQGGRIKIIDGSTAISTPFLDIHSRVSCCGERGLLGLAFDPAYKTNGAFFVDYTDKNGDTIIASYQRRADRPEPGAARPRRCILQDRPAVREPQRRDARLRQGRLPLHRHGRRRLGRRPGQPGPEQEQPARQDPADRRQPRHLGPASTANPPTNPFVGKAGSDRVWALRLPQPVAVQLRQRDRRPVDRRRRPEPLRGDRPVDQGRRRRQGPQLRLAGQLEGNVCYKPSTGCSTTGKSHPIAVYTHSQGLRGRGRLRLPRHGVPGHGRRLPVRRLLLRSDLGAQGQWRLDPDRRPVCSTRA